MEHKSVRIEEADNGYTISHSNEKGESKIMIAKDMKEAQSIMIKMMSQKMSKEEIKEYDRKKKLEETADKILR